MKRIFRAAGVLIGTTLSLWVFGAVAAWGFRTGGYSGGPWSDSLTFLAAFGGAVLWLCAIGVACIMIALIMDLDQ